MRPRSLPHLEEFGECSCPMSMKRTGAKGMAVAQEPLWGSHVCRTLFGDLRSKRSLGLLVRYIVSRKLTPDLRQSSKFHTKIPRMNCQSGVSVAWDQCNELTNLQVRLEEQELTTRIIDHGTFSETFIEVWILCIYMAYFSSFEEGSASFIIPKSDSLTAAHLPDKHGSD